MGRRLFVAIDIPADPPLIEFVSTLKQLTKFDKIKWVELHNLHITLRFIGDTPEFFLAPILQYLQLLSGTEPSFNSTLGKMGIFGSAYDPKVIWLKISNQDAYSSLALKINSHLQLAGIVLDTRPFVPHLTLGRINHCSDKKNLRAVVEEMSDAYEKIIQVKEFHLIESTLTPKGPIYTKLLTVPLGEKFL